MDWFSRLRRGEPEAQHGLRRELLPRLEAVCLRLLGDARAAREVAHDVLSDFMVDHVDRLQEPRAVHAYVRMIAVRRCLRLRERAARHESLEVEPAVSANAEELADARRRHGRLEECLSRLSAKARQVVRLRYELDLTQEVIGERLGFTKQYAGRVLAKSVEALRRCMEAAS